MEDRFKRDRSVGRPRDPILGALSFRGLLVAIAVLAVIATAYHVLDTRSHTQMPAAASAPTR